MRKVSVLAALSVMASLHGSAAQTPGNQVWVSSKGVDASNCGALSSPCRTLQYAHDKIAPGGEIDVRDSAGYGVLSITKPISVIGDGSIVGITGAAITINVGVPGTVTLRNLTIDGMGVLSGGHGITHNQGRTVVIDHCVIQNFHQATGRIPGGYGLNIAATAGPSWITITNSSFIGNNRGGITSSVSAPINLRLDNVSLLQNQGAGIDFGTGNINITNTLSASNQIGMSLHGSTNINLDNVNVSGNGIGIYLFAQSQVHMGRSSVLGNTTHDVQFRQDETNILYTYGTNQIGSVAGGTLTNVSPR